MKQVLYFTVATPHYVFKKMKGVDCASEF